MKHCDGSICCLFYLFTGIELRRKAAAHKKWKTCFDDTRCYTLPIRTDLENPPPRRLVSRSPIWLDCEIQADSFDISDKWATYWSNSPNFSNKGLIVALDERLEGFSLERREWKMLNRFRSGHGCSASQMYQWNFIDSPYCDCGDGTTIQTLSHITDECPHRKFDGGIQELHSLNPNAMSWLKNLDINV